MSRSRYMATAGKKNEFLCIIPDRPNISSLRKTVKRGHYEGIQPLIAQGKLVAGGAIFKEHPEGGKEAQFKGSVIVYTGKDAEEVRDIISKDIYATSGVWDLKKIQIFPYVPAVRLPLPKSC
ncbi:hypothetical protein N7462_011641 [Penicillium macrosclerotiorum]|uniref:uncharacterized protein n=1 Tax=Penicillium macrosclerotiorum TaxID=303699 RepID=UPI002547ED00|nr:uncharacterized protein N7462_011641 [Penicillium macrosclerotiorum]KAJ5662715.1 hypothetical protein N7462_011641 [Penicillium macrosclerotiorum]